MKFSKIKYILGSALVAIAMGSCTDDLDQVPHIGSNSESVYSTPEGFTAAMAKVYATYVLYGQERKGGDADIDVEYDLLRNLFELQETSTDEVVMRWMTKGRPGLTYFSWDPSNQNINYTYYKIFYSIAVCNEFIRNCTESRISGFSDADQKMVRNYKAEARFIRMCGYALALDLFRKAPFVDEDTPTSGYLPPAYDAKQLYDFLMNEAADIEADLPQPNSYGRASKAALYALSSRIALNGEVYTGENHYNECIAWCNKMLALSGYSLEPDYAKLFNADNSKRTNEIIFAFISDADNALSDGAATYIVAGSCASDIDGLPAAVGLTSGWGTFRIRGTFYDFFEDGDSRKMFWTDPDGTVGLQQYITEYLNNYMGYYSQKWTNLTDEGVAASNSGADCCNTDVPYLRLAEVYLNAAEASLRGGTGLTQDPRELVNLVRRRAFGDNNHDVSAANFNLNFIFEERSRELYHEYQRRPDLIRFNKFTTRDYWWDMKANSPIPITIPEKYNYYPLPAAEISANPNLKNEEY